MNYVFNDRTLAGRGSACDRVVQEKLSYESGFSMKKVTQLKILNPILLILFLYQAGTGVFHRVIPYEFFVLTHGKLGYVFAALALVHVAYNWSWVRAQFFRRG